MLAFCKRCGDFTERLPSGGCGPCTRARKRAAQAAWREAKPDKKRAYAAAWYARHRAQVLARIKAKKR